MSIETANESRYVKGLMVLSELESELLEALEDVCNFLEVLMSHCSVDQLSHEEGIGALYERIKHDGGKHTKLIAKAYGDTP